MKKIKIETNILCADWPKYKTLARDLAHATLQTAGFLKKNKNKSIEISIVYADDALLKGLNRDFMGKNKPTNVLSFPNNDESEAGAIYLGDVVLAFETIKREAKSQGKTFKHHTMHLIVHGILHLIGYDHQTNAQAKKMEKLETMILADFGVKNPYVLDDV
jgi:probable rRNA maturation factor